VAKVLWRTGLLDSMLRMRAALRVPVLTVLTYHHVEDPHADSPFDRGVADALPDQFRRHMELVARYGTALTIEQLVRIVCEGERPPKNPVLVTFDDGYRSCLEVATPILRQVGIPATFFIATRFIEERRLFWWERVTVLLDRARRARHARRASSDGHRTVELPTSRLRFSLDQPDEAAALITRYIKDTHGLPIEAFLARLGVVCDVEWNSVEERRLADQLIMTWDEVRALAAAGMDVESHTRSHRVLQTVPFAELSSELLGSRLELERQLGRPVRAIAYPVGRPITDRPGLHSAVRDAGYRVGFSNATGGSNPVLSGQLRQLRHLDPFDLHRLAMGRDFSDALFLGQFALPQLAYPAHHSKSSM
jgi:peptidoglycan/xylan/chitin deacetylase (PgdA/CDA1 family)